MTQTRIGLLTPTDMLYQALNYQTNQDTLLKLVASLSLEDWETIYSQAVSQEVQLILYDKLRRLKQEQLIPIEIREALRKDYLMVTSRNMVMLHDAGKILKAFKANHLPAIGLKGIFLAEQVYADVGLRSFADLDILVPKKDSAKALNVMTRLGYKITTYYNPDALNLDIKHIPPMKKVNGPFVEIHWSILEENEPFQIGMDGIWQRSVSAKIAGVDVKALCIEDLVVHLCIHLTYQHHLENGLRYLIDLAEVLHQNQSTVDWNLLVSTAKSWGAERVIWLTFHLLEDILGIQVPLIVYQDLVDEPIDQALIERAKDKLLEHGENNAISLTPDLARFSSETSAFVKIKLILNRVFIPKHVMARLYNVSPNSINIYACYPRRLWGLYRYYANAAWQLIRKNRAIQGNLNHEQEKILMRAWLTKQN